VYLDNGPCAGDVPSTIVDLTGSVPQLLQGIEEAEAALRRGELVVLPTDTVYGIAAEAFDPVAVELLLMAKGRGRNMPPPVLVGTVRAAMALVMDLADTGKDLIDEFWPGGLTLVCRSSPTLVWDLGETKGTVAVRMPLHHVALDLLKKTGPLAVSSANVSGQPPATTVDEAMDQLGDAVSVYLDNGPCAGDVPSTIVDLTGSVPRLLRRGVIPVERLQDVVPLALMDDVDPVDVVPEDVPDDLVPEDVADVVPEDVPEDEAPKGHGPLDEVPGDAPEAAPEGPAGPVQEDTGRPHEVFHGLPDVTDQGKPASQDAAE
jgi:tRNA threonylcarbamoyl adenosine modification protein (Sua5/YciO/YrdC/YwlC family)